jgi:biotin-(acetyl-CoA carboxylase) ligase
MYLRETRSTNLVLKEMLREYELPEGFVLRTDFQSAGKGQPGIRGKQRREKICYSASCFILNILP